MQFPPLSLLSLQEPLFFSSRLILSTRIGTDVVYLYIKVIGCFVQMTGVKTMTYQKEKISELNESIHRIALEVVEGGHLNLGFSHYKTIFQLTATRDQDTLIDVTVAYEIDAEDDSLPSKTVSSMLAYIKQLENFLLNESS